jgi:glutamine synthetase
MILCEYVWIDNNGGFRSKTRVLDKVSDITDVPEWNYDGSSTGQAKCGNLTEVILKPVAMFNDPFRKDNFIDSKLIWCEAHADDAVYPASRELAVKSFEQNKENEPWFGIEQEYYLTGFDPSQNIAPYGMYTIDHAKTQDENPYYCKVNYTFGQHIAEEHLMKCIQAGIKMSGINAEVGPSQWEYQVGPCVGIESGDQLMISRYILERVADMRHANVDWAPKPFDGWNGSGCHTNFSTKLMRQGGYSGDGMSHIMKSINNLEKTHTEDVTKMGIGNSLRLTGYHETASEDVFSYGEGTRHTSIRIGSETVKLRNGYFEDRRPGSNMDPYVVTKILNDSTLY